MALVLADRVKETSGTTGTGDISLAGATTGFQSFADTVGDGNTTYYAISLVGGGEFEVGRGTYISATNSITRDEVFDSSNNGSLVDFGTGTKDVFVVYPSDRAVAVDGSTVNIPNSATVPISGGGTGASSASAARTNLGLEIGTDVQAFDANTAKLDATTANFTGTLQEGGQNVVTADEVGTIASQDSDDVNIDGGSIDNTSVGLTTPDTGDFTDFTASGTAEFTSTGAVVLPSGTEAQRPGTPEEAMLRFNNSIGEFEGYNGTEWSSVGGGVVDKIFEGNSSVEVVDTGTGYVAVTVDGTETARFDDRAHLTIGSDSGSGFNGDSILRLQNPNGDRTFLQMKTDPSKRCGVLFGNTTDAVRGEINYDNSDDRMYFSVNNSVDAMEIDSSYNLKFNSGYGSVATAYACRAWVNFDGESEAVSIRASGNVSSITELTADSYQINFSTSMPDANYAATGSNDLYGSSSNVVSSFDNYTTSSVRCRSNSSGGGRPSADAGIVSVVIFR